jgi:histidyl-tRNA synthetase
MSDASIDDVVETTKVAGSVSVLEDFEGESKDYLQDVAKILDAGCVKNLQIDLGVIRGLDYYTGVVFEIDAPKLGAEKQVCGGGSYSLSELFGGEKVFSTGFAIGFDRTLMALEKDGFRVPRKGIEAYVIPVSERMREKAFEIVSALRAKGIAADVDLMRRNLTKNLKYANSIKARKAVIVGEIELEAQSAIVRDMETGYQETVRIDDLAELLSKNGRNGV